MYVAGRQLLNCLCAGSHSLKGVRVRVCHGVYHSGATKVVHTVGLLIKVNARIKVMQASAQRRNVATLNVGQTSHFTVCGGEAFPQLERPSESKFGAFLSGRRCACMPACKWDAPCRLIGWLKDW
jgi:hypothetical protein